ncbi:hypothetical protein [Sphingobacterium multivorum]|uniref:hypothetical protein n=1 Tax=Sphingobacterium multivorum TaxID=28454 RepID=UPI000ED8E667|nr:hypothetical protein [Sphingobacterium multivorum]HAF35167.1 hypothetical protein [Sphingobacterium sp.]
MALQLLVEFLLPIDPQSSVPEAVKLLREQSMVLSVTQINVEITTLLVQFGLYNPQPLSINDLMLGIDEEEDGGKCNIVFP